MIIDNITEIEDKYKLFIVDLFGVIHDGVDLYPNAKNTILRLRKQGKKICFLSNAPRRSERAKTTLASFGIDYQKHYDHIMTSGEYAFQYFSNIKDKDIDYFYFGEDKDRGLLQGLSHRVATAEEADIAISTGLSPHQQVVDVTEELDLCLKNNLTIYCINPDKFVHKKDGRSHICAGAIAEEYAKKGGKVKYFGKPYSGVYQAVLNFFSDIDKKDILCIGDGMETDILGANNAGLDSLLISSGMHRVFLQKNIGDKIREKKLQELYQQYPARPTFVTSVL